MFSNQYPFFKAGEKTNFNFFEEITKDNTIYNLLTTYYLLVYFQITVETSSSQQCECKLFYLIYDSIRFFCVTHNRVPDLIER